MVPCLCLCFNIKHYKQFSAQCRGKIDNKRDLRRGASPLPPCTGAMSAGPLMGNKGPMIMGGNPSMLNMGPPGQRHPSSTLQPPGMGMSRGNQQNLNNIRGKNCLVLLVPPWTKNKGTLIRTFGGQWP